MIKIKKHRIQKAKIVLPIVIFLSGVGIAWQLIAHSPKAQRHSIEVKPPLVTITELVPRTVSIPIYTQGTVSPRTSINLSAETTGRIISTSLNFSTGGFFKKGEILLHIDPNDYQLAIVKAEALVANARQQLAKSEAEYKQKLKEYRGIKQNKISDYALRKPRYEEAKANLKAAKADLELSHIQLARCTIYAPFDGRIVEKKADIGQYVRPGTIVADIYAIDFAEIRLPISQKQAKLLDFSNELDQKITPKKVLLKGIYAGNNYTWEGEIVRTDATIDQRNQLIYLIAQVSDPYSMHSTKDYARPPLTIGTFVRAVIESRLLKNIYKLPRTAVHQDNIVWLLDKKLQLQQRKTTITYRDEFYIYISSGLQRGEQLITSPLDIAIDGMELRI